jgi:hypothetical protein
MDPDLTQLDRRLDDDVLFQTVRTDLLRRYPHNATRGRHCTPVEVILRLLVVKRLYCWSYDSKISMSVLTDDTVSGTFYLQPQLLRRLGAKPPPVGGFGIYRWHSYQPDGFVNVPLPSVIVAGNWQAIKLPR